MRGFRAIASIDRREFVKKLSGKYMGNVSAREGGEKMMVYYTFAISGLSKTTAILVLTGSDKSMGAPNKSSTIFMFCDFLDDMSSVGSLILLS